MGKTQRSTDDQLQHDWEKYFKRRKGQLEHPAQIWGLKVSLENKHFWMEPMEKNGEPPRTTMVSIIANQAIIYKERGKRGSIKGFREISNSPTAELKKKKRQEARLHCLQRRFSPLTQGCSLSCLQAHYDDNSSTQMHTYTNQEESGTNLL